MVTVKGRRADDTCQTCLTRMMLLAGSEPVSAVLSSRILPWSYNGNNNAVEKSSTQIVRVVPKAMPKLQM